MPATATSLASQMDPAAFRKILSTYSLGDFQDAQPFTHGTLQTNLLLRTVAGKFVLRLYENRPPDSIRFELAALNHLAAASFPCPAPIPDRNGDLQGLYNEKPFVLFRFMPGEHDKSADHHRDVASVIATMHTLSAGIQPAGSELRDNYDAKSCLRSAQQNLATLGALQEAESRLLWIKQELATLQLPDELPKGVCHCDTNPTNFLYIDGRLEAVVDFDMASYVPLLYDVANTIYWWASPNENIHWIVRAREIVQAYEAIRPMVALEKPHLYDMLKMVCLLSIGWFAHIQPDYAADRQRISYLNAIGRAEFYRRIFA